MPRHFPKRIPIADRTNKAEVAWGVTPNYNGAWLDVAQTNNEIIRQSDLSDWESVTGQTLTNFDGTLRHVYSERPAINRTGEYFINNHKGGEGVLSDVAGRAVRAVNSDVRYARWMNTSDYEFYGVDRNGDSRIIKINALTDQITVLGDFSQYDKITLGNSQGDGDLNDDRVAVTCKDGNDLVVVVWSMINQSIVSQRTFSGEWSLTDNVNISSLGNYVIIGGNQSGDKYRVYRASDMQYLRDAHDAGHCVMALDADGVTEYLVSIARDDDLYRDTVPHTNIRKINFATGAVTMMLGDGITGWSNDGSSGGEALTGHLGFAPKRPGYVIWSNNDPQGPHSVAWVPMDGSQQIEWMCDHRADESGGYYNEPQATSNFDGSIVAFASDVRSGGRTHSYLVRTKANKCPTITTTNFNVDAGASNGTVVGQLAATYNSSAVNSGWRLHNQLNTAFAVSDSGQITVADSSKIQSNGNQTIDVIVEGTDGQTAEYVTVTVGSVANPVFPDNTTVDAGDDETLTSPYAFSIAASVSNPNGFSLAHTWSIVSGPSTSDDQFADKHNPNTTFTPSYSGTYVLKITVSEIGGDGSTISDTMIYTVGGTQTPDTHNWNPGSVCAIGKDGDEQAAYTQMLGQINSHKNITLTNGDYAYKTFMVYVLWKWGEPNNRDYNNGGAWQFIDDCLAALNTGQSLGIYWIDRRFGYADYSKVPIPSDLRVSPYSYVHVNTTGGNDTSNANLAHPTTMTRKIQLIDETASRYNDDERVVFITAGESSIHLPEGNITGRDGSSVSHEESYFNELIYYITECKKSLTKVVLLQELNFLSTFDTRSEMDLFRALCDHMKAVGGCGISCPDSLACRHPADYTTRCCDGAGDYHIEAYNLFLEYGDDLVLAPQMQAWSVDHTRFDEDYDMVTDGAGQYSFNSHYVIFWPIGFTSRCHMYTDDPVTGRSMYNDELLDFEPIVRAEIDNNPTGFNTTKPTTLDLGSDPDPIQTHQVMVQKQLPALLCSSPAMKQAKGAVVAIRSTSIC